MNRSKYKWTFGPVANPAPGPYTRYLPSGFSPETLDECEGNICKADADVWTDGTYIQDERLAKLMCNLMVQAFKAGFNAAASSELKHPKVDDYLDFNWSRTIRP